MGCCQSKGEALPKSKDGLIQKNTKGHRLTISCQTISERYNIEKPLTTDSYGSVFLVKISKNFPKLNSP